MQAVMPWQLTTELPETAPRDAPRARPTLLERLWRILGIDTSPRHNSVAFTIALVSLSAKLAKSDGVALKIEAETFERLHDVAPAELVNVRRIFDLAAKDSAGFQAYVEKVADLLGHDRALLHDVLEGLFHIAAADGILHPEEEKCLRQTAAHFGLSDTDYRAMRALFIHDPNDPYAVLGLSPDASDAAVKARFRQLAREHHPDLLIARGVPKEFIAVATAKLATVNAAYTLIAKERGL
jgi:DnaJ like chaperone protein